MISKALALTTLAALSATASAINLNYNFETDVTSQFAAFKQVADANANFNFDYSTYVPAAGTNGPTSIPPAPSGAGTKGLRLEANNGDAVAAADSIALFPLSASGLTSYRLKFDLYMQWNGDAAGGAGSSEFITFGGNADGDGIEGTNAGNTSSANAVCYAFCGEGGFAAASGDYRYTKSGVAANATANYNGAAETDHLQAGFAALFPEPTYFKAGCPGRQWTVVEIEVKPTDVKVYVTPTGGIRTLISTVNHAPNLTGGFPFIGYQDVNTSISAVPADNFGLVDNLSVTDLVSGVPDWSVY